MKALLVVAALAGCETKHGTVLWHAYNGAERDALTESAARWNEQHPDQPLELVGVPYGAFADKLTSAIPGGNGPDLFIYPQDRIGDWADSGGGVIEPIEFWLDDARVARFDGKALDAMSYKGSLWGLPLAEKSLALFYRTDLVATPPRTTDELVALAGKLHGRYAIAYANVDLYGHAPWLFGFGGKIVDEHDRLAIATPEAARAMTFARSLVVDHVAPDRADGPDVATLFNDGKTATAVSGPWFIAGIHADVPWAVASLPTVSATNLPAAPLFGAEGVLMSARSRDKDAAFAVMDFLTSDAAAIDRAKRARQIVPNVAAYADPAVAGDPVIAGFRTQLTTAVPMPKAPAMRMVWTPYKTALGEVVSGGADPATKLLGVEREVQGYLDGAR